MTLRELVARVPGSVVAYKLLKNLRFAGRARLGTRGNIRSLGMASEEAVLYVREIFDKVDAVVRRNGGWENKRVLEIGPGDSLGAGVLALARGAACYRAIDRFAVAFDPVAERQTFGALVSEMPAEERARVEEVLEIGADGYLVRGDRFFYSNRIAVESAPERLAERFDVVFSNAVLEHVADVRSSLEAMRELLVPGGVMVHDVDLRSHQRFERHALHFLEYSPTLWAMMTSHTGEPNRVRMPTYSSILAELGFEAIDIDVRERFDAELVRRVKPRLFADYGKLSDEDLSVAAFRFTAIAPDPK